MAKKAAASVEKDPVIASLFKGNAQSYAANERTFLANVDNQFQRLAARLRAAPSGAAPKSRLAGTPGKNSTEGAKKQVVRRKTA